MYTQDCHDIGTDVKRASHTKITLSMEALLLILGRKAMGDYTCTYILNNGTDDLICQKYSDHSKSKLNAAQQL